MSEEKRPITAEDLYELKIATDPQIAPDGRHVLFCLQRVEPKTEKKFSNLWVAPMDSGKPRQFTYGDQVESHPRWSPDGRQIAFLSNRQDEKQAQLHLIPFFGGEARPLTEMKGSFAGFEWSPDGRRLVFQFRQKDAAALEREEDEQKKKLGIVERRITDLNYKLDGAGYMPQEKWHVWTLDIDSGETEQLTEGEYNEVEPRWSPDGRQILFVSNRSDDPAQEIDADDLYLVSAADGSEQSIQAPYGRKYLPSFSPDGDQIAYLGRAQTGRFYQNTSLFVVPVAGGESRNLSAAYDLHLSAATLTDTGGGTPQTAPTWSRDGRLIYCQASDHGDQPLLAFAVNDTVAAKRCIIGDPGAVGSFSLDTAQERIAYLWGTIDKVGEIWLHDAVTKQARALTSFNQALFDDIEFGQIEELHLENTAGGDLHAWILKPAGFDPAEKYASILEIHGGPQMQYGNAFMHEFHVLAAQGYVVFWCNPRGSQGYGEEFCRAIYDRWGTVDYADVMTLAAYMAQQPYIDEARMGVTGGSYGGYMTSLIIGRTDRFKAAVAQRVVSNLISFHGSSDMNWMVEWLTGTEAAPWDDLENYWRQSPISGIGAATTPTMIMHSEQDLRTDREQGEQVFVALKRLGVDTELILFPEESHGLSRGGRTDRRIARLGHMSRWFEKYLR